jgi:hypothetical protein
MSSLQPSIARTWGGRTPAELSSAFEDHMRRTGIAEALEAGAQGVLLLKRIQASQAHFLLITFWNDFESVRRFAGDPIDKAVLYPGDEQFKLLADARVNHSDVPVFTWRPQAQR